MSQYEKQCQHYRMHLQSAGFQDQAFNFARKKAIVILRSRIASTSPAFVCGVHCKGFGLINEDLRYKHNYL